MSRGQHDGSARPYSRFSRPKPLPFHSSSSSIVLTRLSGPRFRSTTSQRRESNTGLWVCRQELWLIPQRRYEDSSYTPNVCMFNSIQVFWSKCCDHFICYTVASSRRIEQTCAGVTLYTFLVACSDPVLTCSQDCAISTYPESDEFNPYM
jgi:hypothetical protein